jgi:hypothetical protein
MLRQILPLFATVLLLMPSYPVRAQVKLPDWEIGLASTGGFGRQAPFWIISNRQGKFLPEKFAGAMEFGFFAESDTGRIIDYDYGFEFYGRQGGSGNLWLHQAYAGVTFNGVVRLRAGMQEEIVGSSMPSLSTGSIIWSGNARPMPKIEIATPGYIPVPFSKGYAEISGVFSHGWFEEGRYVSNVWLHHKNAYLRIGGSFPLNIYYGFNHYAQWGGHSPRYEEPFPTDLRSFMKVLLNRSGDPSVPGTPDGWVINRFGNSLGSSNIGIDLDLQELSAGLYQQDIFEDGSGMRKENFPDGLWGAWVSFTKSQKPVQSIVYEFLHTTHQSGPEHILGELKGNDNYFNHGDYRSGWTYHSFTIGTPFITSPLMNDYDVIGIRNNRVIVHHLGFEGYIRHNIYYRNFFTFSRNLGTYSYPFEHRRDQFSWMLELSGPVKLLGMEAGLTIAADIGSMYGDTLGILLTLRKTGSFK